MHPINAEYIRQLEEQIQKQAATWEQARATIEQMRYALKTYFENSSDARIEDLVINTLALQPCPEVLNKVRADAAMAAISWVWSQGSVLPREAYSYVKRIERGEA